jgi:hypothetical protein
MNELQITTPAPGTPITVVSVAFPDDEPLFALVCGEPGCGFVLASWNKYGFCAKHSDAEHKEAARRKTAVFRAHQDVKLRARHKAKLKAQDQIVAQLKTAQANLQVQLEAAEAKRDRLRDAERKGWPIRSTTWPR